MHRLRSFWLALQGSLWFIPSLMVCLGIVLALGLVEVNFSLDNSLSERWPRIFGAGAAGSRGMLTAIATSMITVAGVVFSITIVALSLAASQYSPRVLRNFMSDRPTQVVLGTFVGIFAYCLIVLRTIRGGDEGAFVPSIAVLGGVVMAFIGVGLLIYFVHHVAASIQVSSILARITRDANAAIDRLFPAEVGEAAEEAPTDVVRDEPTASWASVEAPRTGYVVGVDGSALLDRAAEMATVVHLIPRVGDFVIKGEPLLRIAGSKPADKAANAALATVTIAEQRTVHQDARYALQQMVDVALKALSPSIHDPTTALDCIDHLGAALVRLSDRRIPGPWRFRDGHLRLVARGPDYAEMISIAFVSIAWHAGDHVEVYARLVDTLDRIARKTRDGARHETLRLTLDVVLARSARADLPAQPLEALDRRGGELRRHLMVAAD